MGTHISEKYAIFWSCPIFSARCHLFRFQLISRIEPYFANQLFYSFFGSFSTVSTACITWRVYVLKGFRTQGPDCLLRPFHLVDLIIHPRISHKPGEATQKTCLLSFAEGEGSGSVRRRNVLGASFTIKISNHLPLLDAWDVVFAPYRGTSPMY